MEDLNKKLSSLSLDESRQLFHEKSNEVILKIEAERAATAVSGNKNGFSQNGGPNGVEDWSSEEISLLIKAVNVFPAGTVQRYVYLFFTDLFVI